MVKNNFRAKHIGCSIEGQDAAHYGIARRGLIAHDFATAFCNVSAAELLVAFADAVNNDPKEDGSFKALLIGLIKPIASKDTLAHGAWKEFKLATSALSAPVTESGTGNKVATITMTGAATTYYVVEILSDKVCTLACPGETTPIQVIQNPGLLLAGAIPIGRTAFLIYNTANASRTMTITNTEGDASTGIATADVKVHAVTEWALRELAILT